MKNNELKKGNWVKIYGRVLTGNGALKLDDGRHPYIVVLDSNNKYIGKSFLLVQGTTYNESLLWQKELLENNEGCIVHLNHQSFIFTNNYHLITPSKIDNIIGEIEIGDLHTIGTQLVQTSIKMV